MTTRRRSKTARVIETTGFEILEQATSKAPIANDTEETPPPRDEAVIPFASTLRRIA